MARSVSATDPHPKTGEADYAADLPRIPPKTPAESLNCFQVQPGFQVELAATEPRLASPVAIDFDEDGRLYVAEYVEYNQEKGQLQQGRGRIRLLEDPQGIGLYDKSTVFLDNVESPTAVCCYDGGVYIGSVPDILYAKDTDGDGTADLRRTVFTGFARDRGGEAIMNSFRWSFENRIYVQTSYSGGNVRRADLPDSKPLPVRNQFFVFDPRTEKYEAVSGGGQHGFSFDDWGRKYVNTNNEPAFVIMYDGRYLARNPYLDAPPAMTRVAEGGYTGQVFRISPPEPWRVLRTKWRSQGLEGEAPHPTEGNRPFGYFTAVSGVTIYRGDAWPEEYRGNLFVGEVANNLVFHAKIQPDGVGVKAIRVEPDHDFLASTDVWSRPVQMANAPDGALYVIDMYRHLIQAAAFIPPAILKHLDVSGGFDQGRLYRIVPDNFQRRPQPRLGQATTSELVALLAHPNGWHRDTASRLLYQQQDASAVPLLKKLASNSNSPLGRMHAMYALAGLQNLNADTVWHRLNDSDPRVREHALRFAERFASEERIRVRMRELTSDPDQRVRYQLAFSLGDVPGDQGTRALVQLAMKDGADAWCQLAILSSANGRAAALFQELLSRAEVRITDHGRDFLLKLAGLMGSANRAQEIASFSQSLISLPQAEQRLQRDLLLRFLKKWPASGRSSLVKIDRQLQPLITDVLEESQAMARNESLAAEERVAAMQHLRLRDFSQIETDAAQWLHFRQPQTVQMAAVDLLGRFDNESVPKALISAWPNLSPQLRASAVETLSSRQNWIVALLDAVERGDISRGDINPTRMTELRKHNDERIRTRAEALFANNIPESRIEVVRAYEAALARSGNASQGKGVFQKACAACHQLDRVGTQIGADLNAMRGQSKQTILLNILDPNREVKPQFLTYVVATQEGRTVSGMITAETANDLTLRKADGTSETVLRIDIEELSSTGLSFMPEGLEKQIDVAAMADLLEYLSSAE